jgi:hypothetical protein
LDFSAERRFPRPLLPPNCAIDPFLLTYNDGSFSASGSFDSGTNFGEMGTERNGFFVNHELVDDAEAGAPSLSLPLKSTQMSQTAASGSTKQAVKLVLLKGRVPVKVEH